MRGPDTQFSGTHLLFDKCDFFDKVGVGIAKIPQPVEFTVDQESKKVGQRNKVVSSGLLYRGYKTIKISLHYCI